LLPWCASKSAKRDTRHCRATRRRARLTTGMRWQASVNNSNEQGKHECERLTLCLVRVRDGAAQIHQDRVISSKYFARASDIHRPPASLHPAIVGQLESSATASCTFSGVNRECEHPSHVRRSHLLALKLHIPASSPRLIQSTHIDEASQQSWPS
jgi:hypothetical protein